jgi:hypothetical protein
MSMYAAFVHLATVGDGNTPSAWEPGEKMSPISDPAIQDASDGAGQNDWNDARPASDQATISSGQVPSGYDVGDVGDTTMSASPGWSPMIDAFGIVSTPGSPIDAAEASTMSVGMYPTGCTSSFSVVVRRLMRLWKIE